MTTAQDIIASARYLSRDPDGIDLTDAMALSMLNSILATIHQTLINVHSDLVRAEADQITTVDGTAEYTLESGASEVDTAGILPEGIWQDGYPGNPLTRKIKSELVAAGYNLSDEAQPVFWYPVDMNTVGFCPTPDDEYTYNVYYWEKFTDLAATSDTVPFLGIFDQALRYWLAVEYLNTIGEDTSYLSIQLQNAYGTAIQNAYGYGCTNWRASGDMFDVEGL